MRSTSKVTAAVLTALAAAGAIGATVAGASAATAAPSTSVTAVTSTSVTLAVTGNQYQVVNLDTLASVVHAGGSGKVTVSGLSAGTAYEARASFGHGWSVLQVFITPAAGAVPGPKGDTGPAGPSGLTATDTETGSAALPHVGGSWASGHAVVKTVALKAGTYLVTLTGDFYKTAATPATPVLQIQLNGASRQLTGYTGAFPYNAAEATGTGTDGTPNGLEQTATAYGIVTLAAAGNVEIDAFGYNPDRSAAGSGDFAVNATASFAALAA